jgi:hypothetical protein
MLERVHIAFRYCGDQAFALPGHELPGLQVEYAEHVLTGISGHGIVSVQLGLLSLATASLACCGSGSIRSMRWLDAGSKTLSIKQVDIGYQKRFAGRGGHSLGG